MACCSTAPAIGGRKRRQERPDLSATRQSANESRIAARVTELIEPSDWQKQQPSAGPRGWAQHLPVVIVPGMCSSGLKVLKSADEPSWENDRIWLSMQKLSLNKVEGSRVGTMQQVNGATVTVVIERAQRLPAADANGLSDPFVKLMLLVPGGGLLSRMWQTSVKHKTLEPEWEEDFLLGTRSNVDEASVCLIEVMDKDAMGSDDTLGRLEFSMDKVKAGDYSDAAWHKLEQGPNPEIQAQGSLRLSIRYEPAPPPTPPTQSKEPPPPDIDDMFSKLSTQEALEACEDLGIVVTAGETTLLNMQAAIRAHFCESAARNPRAVFAEMDTDGSGSLDHEEVERATAMLGFLFNREQASHAFAEMDADNDEEISVDEFEAWWERQLQKQEAEAAQDPTRNEGRGADAVADPCPWGQRAADARKKLLGSSAWVRHMCLAEDGRSDPAGIQVRAFRGLPGVAYLQAGAMSPFTWVFAKVIDHLLANGYTANVNLMACPYDWRLALRWQEERDGYFSKLMQTIEDAKANSGGKPVVLLAHSMGNRTVHYFLNWVANTQDNGQQWLDAHVHSFFASGAPFLGASSAFRGAMLGEDFGIGAFINQDLATILCRSCSAGPEVFPVGALESAADRPGGIDLVYSRHEGRATIDVLVADLTPASGSPLSMQFDIEHSRLKNQKRHTRSQKTRNNFVDSSKGPHGGVAFHQRFQFVTEDVNVDRATGEALTFALRVDKTTVGSFSLPVSEWFTESSKRGTVHVDGLDEKYEQPQSLTTKFGSYGTVVAVTTCEQSDESSWALVSFKEEDATDKILTDADALNVDGLVVKIFDMNQRVDSTGEMSRVLMEHRRKLKDTGSDRALRRAQSSSSRNGSSSGDSGTQRRRRRRDSRIMARAHRHDRPSDEVYDLDLGDVSERFRYMAATRWSKDRWYNLELKAFCFAGRDALEWLKRWLFESELPHSHADALHLANRLMADDLFEAVASTRVPRSGHASASAAAAAATAVVGDGLYRLASPYEEAPDEALLPGGEVKHINCVGQHGLTAHETTVAGYNCDHCGVEDLPAGTRLYGCTICDYDVCQKCWDVTYAPGATRSGRGRMSVTLGMPNESLTPDNSIYVVGACGTIHRGRMGEKLWFDTTATPGGDIVVSRQEGLPGVSGQSMERTAGYGEIALRPNHGKTRWNAETEMSLKPPDSGSSSRRSADADMITVSLDWELLEAASEPETIAEEQVTKDHEQLPTAATAAAAGEAGSWSCIDEIAPSAGHPKAHPDDDCLEATPEENKYVGYRTVRLENKAGECVAELHIVLTFESAPIQGYPPQKLDEHCPYMYEPREQHEMLVRHGARDCVDIHEGSEQDPNGLMHGTLFKAPPCKRVFHAYGTGLDTEVGYFFKHKNGVELMPSGPKSSCGVELDSTASMSDQNFKVKSGVIYETKTTRQTVDGSEIRASGDGTVPYYSLRYSKQWDGPTCRSEICEIDDSEHREILADSRFHSVLLEYLSETLVCYVLEAKDLSLANGGQRHAPNPYVVATLQYQNGASSEPQKSKTFHRQPQPQFKKVMTFGAGKCHLGGIGKGASGSGGGSSGSIGRPGLSAGAAAPATGTASADAHGADAAATGGSDDGSLPAIGVQFEVFSSRNKPLQDELLGVVFISVAEVLASPTRAVQAWYTLAEPSGRGSSSNSSGGSGGGGSSGSGNMRLRIHAELEDPGQSYRGREEQAAIAAALEQDPQSLDVLP